MQEPLIGRSVKRSEDPRLITGSATYTDDIQKTGMLYAYVIRSPYAHARIVKIDKAAAESMEGVTGVYTYDDLAAYFKAPLPCAWAAFPDLKNPAHWPLAPQIARHVGDPIAVVVATDRALAKDAADLVEVEYDALPAIVDPAQALAPGAPKVHAELADNVAYRFNYATAGVDAAFAQADVVVKHRFMQQRLVPHALEPRAYVAEYHRANGELTLTSSTQIPHLLKLFTAVCLGLPEHLVRVIAPEVGGGFGSKLQVYAEEIIACALAMHLGKPIKWTMERREEFLATHHGREGIMEVSFAAAKSGQLQGIKVDWIADMGAYNMLNGPYVPILGFLVLPGPYANREFGCNITGVFTNKTGTDAYRGAGRPEATYVLERMMDLLAAELGMDPVAVRQQNLIPADQFPFTNASGITYDVGEYHGALDTALKAIDYAGFRREQMARVASGSPKLLGIGLSTYIEACGLAPAGATHGSAYGAHLYESAQIQVHQTGKVTVFTGASAHGQGHETTFAQLVADRLGVAFTDVVIRHGDTAAGPFGLGTYGSRSLVVGGMAIWEACERVRAKATRIAAHLLDVPEAQIEMPGHVAGDAPQVQHARAEGHFNGCYCVKGSPERSLSFAEIAARANLASHAGLPAGMEPGLDVTVNFTPSNFSYPAGTHICTVEVDTETGKVDLLRFVAVDDCGTVLNPLIAEGQVHGGLAQGIAQALFEELRYDEYGQPLGTSLMEYAFPSAPDLPSFETQFHSTPSPTNPLGAKGIGEAGTIGSTPAVINAVCDALRHLGVKDIDMPATPPRVWAAIQAAGRQQ
ncbi:MAG TPA: xanthine dehydrogenase family protein molybdopterin-binding subunit [Symbiobacteriaceae bacterium]|nr:xanthine dehydrogenase family protein molybdopterin-binding subunit [Symbiobacteriaceae bacterium]